MHSKKQKRPFTFSISTIVPNDTRIHIILKFPQTISTVFNTLSFPFYIFHYFKPDKNKNKLRTNWGWNSQKTIKNNEPRRNLLVRIKKECSYFKTEHPTTQLSLSKLACFGQCIIRLRIFSNTLFEIILSAHGSYANFSRNKSQA